jgi:hypothetical protein
MKRVNYFIVAVAALFLSGGLSEAANMTASTPDSIIFKLYEKHRPQAGKGIPFDNKKVLSQFFTEDLTALFLRNAECQKLTRSVCNLNMDPVYNAQDYGNSPLNLKVKKVASEPQLRYEVTFTNIGRTTLIIELSNTKAGWRISDILYSSKDSLRALLSQPE